MDQFQDETIVKIANIYYEGKVTSRTVYLADGTRKTFLENMSLAQRQKTYGSTGGNAECFTAR